MLRYEFPGPSRELFIVLGPGRRVPGLGSYIRTQTQGRACQTWTVRSTMHTIPSKDYWVYVFGGPGRRFQPWFDRTAKKRGIPHRDFSVRLLYKPFLH